VANLGPPRAIVVVEIALNVANGKIVPKTVLEDLFGQFLFVDRLQPDAGGDLEMPTVRWNFAPADLHFFRIFPSLDFVTFSGSDFMLGVSFAQRLATSGSRAKR
jgi:hypothetical protein